MGEKSVFSEQVGGSKEDSLNGATSYFCALVFKAPIKTFEQVRDYLLKFSDAELIFQTKSVDYLWIVRAPPKYSVINTEMFLQQKGAGK